MSSNPNPSDESNALVPVPAAGALVRQTESSLALVQDVLREGDSEYWLEKAEVARSVGDYDLALFRCNKAIALRPDWAEAYAQRARAYNAKEDYSSAKADCEKALLISSHCTTAFFARGFANQALGEAIIQEASS